MDRNFPNGKLTNCFLDQINPDDKNTSYTNSSLSFMKKSELEKNKNHEKFYFYSKGRDFINVVDLMNYIAFPSFEDEF